MEDRQQPQTREVLRYEQTEGTQRRVFRLTGVVSIIVAVVMVVADELLQYLPQGYASLLPWREIATWRLLSGSALGVLTIPLSAIGY